MPQPPGDTEDLSRLSAGGWRYTCVMWNLLDGLRQETQWERCGVMVVLAVPVYLILLAVGRYLKRRMELPLGLSYQMAAAATGLYLAVILIEPELVWRREFWALAVLAGVRALLPLVNRVLAFRLAGGRRSESLPKFLRQVLSLFLFIVAVLLVLQVGYHIQLPGLIAGSGIAALAIGLAAQDLLGNIIGGFTLHFARPFQVRDWILLDGQHVQVIEINWRSTRFRNNDNTRIDVPNSHIVKQTIINYYGHDHGAKEYTRPHAMRLEVGVDSDAPPNRVKELLAKAAASVPRVMPQPAPDVFLRSFGDSNIVYEVRYWLGDHAEHQRVSEGIRTHIWYALRREGIRIPFPIRTLKIEPRATAGKGRHGHRHDALLEMLEKQPVFAALTADSLAWLLERSGTLLFGDGEKIIEENAAGESMFVITGGRAVVILSGVAAAPSRIAELGAGECFGEMSLLTGEPRNASIQALGDCEVLEITKSVFGVIMEREENLMVRLSELLARRKLETEGIASRLRDASQGTGGGATGTNADQENEYKARLLRRIRSFFEL